MSDPFLRSGDENIDADEISDDELLRRSGLPRDVFEQLPREHVEQFISRVESWATLAADLDRILVSAGFHRHDPRGPGGGFSIATWLRSDAVVVSWALRDRMKSAHDPFEDRVESIMHPTLAAIFAECGYDAEIIPDDQDDAGCVLVTGPVNTRFSTGSAF
jgi:hypothetical protein